MRLVPGRGHERVARGRTPRARPHPRGGVSGPSPPSADARSMLFRCAALTSTMATARPLQPRAPKPTEHARS
eukprot:1472113-Rhodomonas_salina.2